jgi:hypothetical protein
MFDDCTILTDGSFHFATSAGVYTQLATPAIAETSLSRALIGRFAHTYIRGPTANIWRMAELSSQRAHTDVTLGDQGCPDGGSISHTTT